MVNWDYLINNGVTGAISGAIAGGVVSWVFRWRDQKKEDSEKIYAPLLTEFKNKLKAVEEYTLSGAYIWLANDRREWDRITQKDHISHRMKPKIKQKVARFYEETSNLYREKCKAASQKINETIKEELNKRCAKADDLNGANILIENLYSSFFAEKLNKQSFLESKFVSINLQLEKKYQDFDAFFKENLNLLNQKKEIKEIREERNKLIEHIKQIILLLAKKLK